MHSVLFSKFIYNKSCIALAAVLLLSAFLPACQFPDNNKLPNSKEVANFSLKELQERTFKYFWELADTSNYQIPDRYPRKTFSSVAATGFALPSYIIGVERKFITREQAVRRVLNTLKTLYNLPQGDAATGVSGYRGFYYHFLNYDDATRFKNVELSTIDTALLMAGILAVQSYFEKNNASENEIRKLADLLYRRVEWDWAINENGYLSMGWHPEKGFIKSEWKDYNEAIVLLLLAIASPTHPIPKEVWDNWCNNHNWAKHQGYEYVNFHALFGHQYSHMFVDLRGIQDKYMREKGIDYFENSRRATYANRAYCINNKLEFKGYSENCWGLSACDGPRNRQADTTIGNWIFKGYAARGSSVKYTFDDGTITPTAAGGSIAFAPEICTPVLKNIWENYHQELVGQYGFKDAFNLSYTFDNNKNGWFDNDYLGIDQGPILIQIENHKTELIWNLMKKNPYIREGLKRAGFTGGWLEK